MATTKKIKKQSVKKEKLIPISLVASFSYVFFKSNLFVQGSCLLMDDKNLADILKALGYDVIHIGGIPNQLVKVKIDHLKIPSYKYYLHKFIFDCFEINIIELSKNRYFIDTQNELDYDSISTGLIKLGFITE